MLKLHLALTSSLGDDWLASRSFHIYLRECANGHRQGYFCDGTLRNTVPEVFLRRTHLGTAFLNIVFLGSV